jgi:hypothetical protein
MLDATERPDLERLSAFATRYGVSLSAVILRRLEYTETRAVMIVSNGGFDIGRAQATRPTAARAFVHDSDHRQGIVWWSQTESNRRPLQCH